MTNFRKEACLVAYFSRPGYHYIDDKLVDLPVGNTQTVAQLLTKLTGAKEFRIEPEKPYPNDLRLVSHMAQRELYADARPKLLGRPENLEEYSVVFLGFPIWWGTMPMPVVTFLEQCAFSDPVLLPFCTHEGAGFGHSEHALRVHCPRARVLPGLAVPASRAQTAEEEAQRWLSQIDACLSTRFDSCDRRSANDPVRLSRGDQYD